MRRLIAAAFLTFAGLAAGADVSRAVVDLIGASTDLRRVPFSNVVHAATGRRVLPFNVTNRIDAQLLAKIGIALDKVLRRMNEPGPAAARQRINEMSALFETAVREELNVVQGFTCEFPKTSAGRRQRSGYPDLRLVDAPSGRIIYLDPKLFERRNRGSSLRTFYYEPKRDTNKILDDAHHLIVGFEHDGKVGGAWRFTGWELVDLSRFEVSLKAEFQAGNRELYRPEATVGRSATNAGTGAR